MRTRSVVRAAVAVGLAAAFLAGCGSSGGSEPKGTTSTTIKKVEFATTTEAETTTTGAASSTTAVTSTTSGGAATTTEPSNGLKPGDACSLEEGSPDCIDPDGDGEGTYLIGGAACIASAPDPASCTDLDGDGYAGYPDSQ